MNYRPKVVRCRLKTGGKSIPQIREECRGQGLTYRDFENIQRSNEEFDGLVVLLSLWAYDNHASYHLHNWDPADDEKMMMAIYYAEQVHPFPRYKNDLAKFKADWAAQAYDPGGASLTFAPADVEISIHAPHAGRDWALFTIRAGLQPFQSTRPMRGATAKVNKLLCTFLQKRHGFQIFLRKTLPFKAFCRLQIGKNFSICGANRCGNFCELLLRTIRSSVLPEGRSACSQNAQFYSHTFSRDNRNADCLFPDP